MYSSYWKTLTSMAKSQQINKYSGPVWFYSFSLHEITSHLNILVSAIPRFQFYHRCLKLKPSLIKRTGRSVNEALLRLDLSCRQFLFLSIHWLNEIVSSIVPSSHSVPTDCIILNLSSVDQHFFRLLNSNFGHFCDIWFMRKGLLSLRCFNHFLTSNDPIRIYPPCLLMCLKCVIFSVANCVDHDSSNPDSEITIIWLV